MMSGTQHIAENPRSEGLAKIEENSEFLQTGDHKNRQKFEIVGLHSPKATVLYAVPLVGIDGPWFFEENKVAVIVNLHRFLNLLQVFFAAA